MPKTRIRMLVRADVQGSIVLPNTEIDPSPEEAHLWLDAGMAELVTPAPAEAEAQGDQ